MLDVSSEQTMQIEASGVARDRAPAPQLIRYQVSSEAWKIRLYETLKGELQSVERENEKATLTFCKLEELVVRDKASIID